MSRTLRSHVPCRTLLALACLVLSSSHRLPAQDVSPSLTGIHLVRNARILVQPGQVIDQGCILIEDGLIRDVGEALEAPPGATILEGEGLVVTAGFVVAGPLVKEGEPASPTTPAVSPPGGSEPGSPTQQRRARGLTPARMACDVVNDVVLGGRVWLRQGITACLAFPDGKPAAGHGCLVSMAAGTTAERIHQETSALRVAFSGVRSYPRSIMGTVAALRQLFISAAHHVQVKELYRIDPAGLPPPVWQPDLDALAPVMRGRRPVLFEARREGDIRRALGLCHEFKLVGWIRGARPLAEQAAQLADRGVVAVVDLDPGKITFEPNKTLGKGPDTSEPRGAQASDDDESKAAGKSTEPGSDAPAVQEQPHVRLRRQEKQDKEREELSRFYALARTLSEKKIPFFFGARKAKDLLDRIRAQVRWGLPQEQALMALTVEPARVLGLTRSRGRIAAGMVADLVVFDGDPFAEGKILHVFSRGVRHDVTPEEKPTKTETEDQR